MNIELTHELGGEVTPWHEIQAGEVEDSPARRVEGGFVPCFAHKWHAQGQVLEAQPLEDENQAI